MTTCKNPQPLNFGASDKEVFRRCAFLVNVLSNMYEQWIGVGSPTPPLGQFNWQPVNACPIITDFKVTDYSFGDLIWSTFSYTDAQGVEQTVTEPFGSVVKSTVDDSIYLVFRGSKSKADFLVDLETALVPYTAPTTLPPSGIQVEKGWYAVYSGLYEILRVRFKSLRSRTLIITGHSLGSALATLAVPDAVANLIEVHHYNSASPMVGNDSFRTYYESLSTSSPGVVKETYRLVNKADSVPNFPKAELGYVHVGTEISFNADYGAEEKTHNPCCSYGYALNHPDNPCNPTFDACNVPPN